MGLLTEEHLAAIGTSEPPVTVEVTRRDIVKYSTATEQRQERFLRGDEAPPMFVFNLFTEIPNVDQLRPDGLARRAINGPSLPLKRVMAGGTEIRVHRPIVPGDRLTGTRSIVDMFEKKGRSGPLIFTVRQLVVTDADGATVLEERQTAIAR